MQYAVSSEVSASVIPKEA